MHEELESLKENNVFELTNLPEGKKTVGSKWVYTTKENPDGSKRYKARFFAREDSARKRVWTMEKPSLLLQTSPQYAS